VRRFISLTVNLFAAGSVAQPLQQGFSPEADVAKRDFGSAAVDSTGRAITVLSVKFVSPWK
jgi:hypothetical protein